MVELEHVRKYLTTCLVKYRGHSEYEDAFQEGMIRAWKDIEDGNTEFLHVARRARVWAFNFIQDSATGRRRATGAHKLTNDGRRSSQGEASREKISSFVEQYFELHDKRPSNVEISQATGLSTSVVSYQLKQLRDGKGINHAIYADHYGEQRIDYKAYTIGHITDENRDYLSSLQKVTWEEEFIDELDFYRTLEMVDPVHREVLYWHHVEGYNAKEVARLLGTAGNSTTGIRRIRAAHDAVKAALYPDEYGEVCRNGHLRTRDNTVTSIRTDKQIAKTCLDCKKDKRKRQAGRRKLKANEIRAQKTHCKNDHEIRGFKSGRRYCKLCNYISRYPGRTTEDISPNSKLWNWDER